MGDDQATRAPAPQGVIDTQLGDVVERTRGFVQYQHGGVVHQRPGDFQTLPLATTEVAPMFLHLGIVAAGAGNSNIGCG